MLLIRTAVVAGVCPGRRNGRRQTRENAESAPTHRRGNTRTTLEDDERSKQYSQKQLVSLSLSQGHPYLTSLGSVRYLVLDEADRMIEFGHYHELSRILERLNRVTKGAEFGGVANVRQTFVFSATLSLPRRSSEKRVKVRQKKNLSGQESIGIIIITQLF